MSDSEFYSREYNNRVLFPDHPAVMARWADKSRAPSLTLRKGR